MSQKSCKLCHRSAMRRINRRSRWEQRVMCRLGFYPWECVFCRKRQFIRDEGFQREVAHSSGRSAIA